MPRRRSGSSGSSKPRSSPSPSPQSKPKNTRDAHTAAAAPPAPAQSSPGMAKSPDPPAAGANESSKPGLLAQMASTAGSVALGSVIGHGISSMLFGGSSAEALAPEQEQQQQQSQQLSGAGNCEQQAKDFSKCLEKADLQTCSWYLEQLKACQAAASPY